LSSDFDIVVFLLPRMVGGMMLAGLVQAILPPDLVARWVGEESGLRGIVIATVVGGLTPGGPMTSFPIVVAFYMSGADRGALVAYLTGWSLIGFQRTLVWELPLLGPEFTLYRIAVVATLPILAGLLARRIPLGPVGPERDSGRGV
ncbi:MAG TPA: permease, partial [Alphaproteobacteria bacterium]|nr:permease [Alphaproteobacteria bacterium]